MEALRASLAKKAGRRRQGGPAIETQRDRAEGAQGGQAPPPPPWPPSRGRAGAREVPARAVAPVASGRGRSTFTLRRVQAMLGLSRTIVAGLIDDGLRRADAAARRNEGASPSRT
jgi:hypothetical protein